MPWLIFRNRSSEARWAQGDDYLWNAGAGPAFYPPIMEGLIESIGLTQSGCYDDGQWCDYAQHQQ